MRLGAASPAAVTLPLHCRCTAVTLPLRLGAASPAAVTLRLHCRYIVVALPLHCRHVQVRPLLRRALLQRLASDQLPAALHARRPAAVGSVTAV